MPDLRGLLRAAGVAALLTACASAPARAPAAAFAVDAHTVEPLAPIALDANDGTALDFEQLDVLVTLHGPIAHTAIYARFVNPLDRQIEGRFRLVMPPRSSVSRLAMRIRSEWREAEVAETSVARETYETIMHRRRDPLLVEQPREREIAARIAPIFAREVKEVRLEYTSELSADRPFVVPLRGLPTVKSLTVSIVDGATEPVHLELHDEKPTADVRYADAKLASAHPEATRIPAEVPALAQPLDHAVYLVDTSASADLDAAQALLAALPKAPVIAYDQTAAYVASNAELRARGALGLADLRPALALAGGARRIVIIGGGTLEPTDLASPAERIDVLGTTATVDARTLRPLARNGLVIEGAPLVERGELLRRLEHRAGREEHIVYHAPKDPAIAHAFAAARVGELTDPREIVALAHEHRLVTPFTALIVLENDGDAQRLRSSEAPSPPPPPPPPAPAPPAPRPAPAGRAVKAPSLRMGATVVNGRLPPEVIQRTIRLRAGTFQACYLDGRRRDPRLAGRVIVKFVIERDGSVSRAADAGSEIQDRATIDCMVHAFSQLQFSPPEGGIATVVYPFLLSLDQADVPRPLSLNPMALRYHHSPFEDAFKAPAEPWSEAYTRMREDPSIAPRTPVGLVALGAALEAKGDQERAARAYASLVELWPERADLARAAAVRLDRLGSPLAVPLLRRAVHDRPDQPSGHHLLGLALLRRGDREGARAAFKAGLERRYELRYAGAVDLFRADLALLEPSTTPLARLSLAWESDTSDVDVLPTNDEGELRNASPIASANDGYGPEVIDATDATHVRVKLQRRGMGGDVLGAVYVIKRNERGDVTVEPRPFEIMTESSVLDLGKY